MNAHPSFTRCADCHSPVFADQSACAMCAGFAPRRHCGVVRAAVLLIAVVGAVLFAAPQPAASARPVLDDATVCVGTVSAASYCPPAYVSAFRLVAF